MKRAAVALLFLAAGLAYAQPPVAWWENPVANGLSLSEYQRERINRIVADARRDSNLSTTTLLTCLVGCALHSNGGGRGTDPQSSQT